MMKFIFVLLIQLFILNLTKQVHFSEQFKHYEIQPFQNGQIFLQIDNNTNSLLNSTDPKSSNDDDDTEGSQDEATKKFLSLIDKIYDYAKEISKIRPDPEKRRIKAGILPNFYPKQQRDQALKAAQERKKKGAVVKYITEPYRFCVFPHQEVNSITYCENTFRKVSIQRATDCNHMMCINCCNHMLLAFKQSLKQSITSETLGLADDAGFNKVKGSITSDVIKNCRNACDKEYPVKKIQIQPPPAKDPLLGRDAKHPATSCIDIKLNGVDADDGVYYVQTGKKPAFKVYCDMKTLGGGWTLFYAYSHHPYEDYQLDSTQLPTDPINGRQHMHLQQAGFSNLDVGEVRFYCQTSHMLQGKQQFIHFKTTNQDIIKVAMTGDQSSLKQSSWVTQFVNLDVAQELQSQFIKSDLPKSVSQYLSDVKGGFWNLPFSSASGGWNIKGTGKTGSWQCGDSNEILSGAKYETLHQVWFRGQGPTKEFLQQRALRN